MHWRAAALRSRILRAGPSHDVKQKAEVSEREGERLHDAGWDREEEHRLH